VRHKTFRPFGREYAVVGSLQSERTWFAGHRRNDDSGFYYMQARWMDPNAGVFVSIAPVVPDAFDPQAVNAFAYARNNPSSIIDPTGTCGATPLGNSFGCPDPSVAYLWGGGRYDRDGYSSFERDQQGAWEERLRDRQIWKRSARSEAQRESDIELQIPGEPDPVDAVEDWSSQGREEPGTPGTTPSAEQQALEESNALFARRWFEQQLEQETIPSPGPHEVSDFRYDPSSPPGDKPRHVKHGENRPTHAALPRSDIVIYSPGAKSIRNAIVTVAHEYGHFNLDWSHPDVYEYGEAAGRVFDGETYTGPTQ